MKKTKIIIAALTALCISATLCACTEAEPAREDTSAAVTTTEATTAVETTAAPKETSQEQETSSAAEESSREEDASSQEETSSAAEKSSTAEETPYDYSGMAGYWYIDGDYETAYIHIMENGTFVSYYASDSEEMHGKISRELDTNTNNYVFTLSGEEGGPYLFFADDGKTDKTDLYTAGENPVHYVKLYGEGGLGDDGRGSDEEDADKPGGEFLGTWGCGRATIHIYKTSMPVPERDKFFYIDIYWSDSAFAHVEWSLVGEYKDGKLICDKNGVKTYVEYQDAETPPKRTVEYTEGSAEFELRDGKLYWNDLEENAAVGMEFINTPPLEDY